MADAGERVIFSAESDKAATRANFGNKRSVDVVGMGGDCFDILSFEEGDDVCVGFVFIIAELRVRVNLNFVSYLCYFMFDIDGHGTHERYCTHIGIYFSKLFVKIVNGLTNDCCRVRRGIGIGGALLLHRLTSSWREDISSHCRSGTEGDKQEIVGMKKK